CSLLSVFSLGGCANKTQSPENGEAGAEMDESSAVKAVEEAGGVVQRDPSGVVIAVKLANSRTIGSSPDALLKEMAPLTGLTSLDLTGVVVTDAGMKEVAKFTRLKTLKISGTWVRVPGLKNLAALTELTTLELGGSLVVDPGMKELAP